MSRLVHVEWEDACSVDEWTDLKDFKQKPKDCEAIGFLTRTTKRAITLSVSISSEKEACCSLVIPRRAILKIRKVKVGKKTRV